MLGPAAFGTAGAWRRACGALLAAAAPLREILEAEFQPVAVTDGDQASGLFTGYYEPELRGSRLRGGPYQAPIYALPADLVSVDLGLFRESWRGERLAGRVVEGRLRPYETRSEIEDGALQRQAKALAWVDDRVDAFFLQIQGSGQIRLADGGTMRVGFAGQNGHPYVPIGRLLVERGELSREKVSMQSIRQWLADNPARADALMRANPSYVFFREILGDGPLGSEGVALTPGRSLAVDRSQIALGVPVWLDAEDPLDPTQRVRRLLVAQDTGGAIRGIVRGDVFWGAGEDAAERAGRMRARGRFWVLLQSSALHSSFCSSATSDRRRGDDHRVNSTIGQCGSHSISANLRLGIGSSARSGSPIGAPAETDQAQMIDEHCAFRPVSTGRIT